MVTTRQHLDHGDRVWVITVVACCLFVAAILVGWSQLRSY
jgi:hypothetical protein